MEDVRTNRTKSLRESKDPHWLSHRPLSLLALLLKDTLEDIIHYCAGFHIYEAGIEGPVVFCLHGGGYSGLSFALSASKIKENARVVAMDLRGHGKSFTNNDLDLSIETLCDDVVAVLKALYGDSPPAIIIVGHSMGGSVAVHVVWQGS
ncbi:hypothetical protein HPP92_005618 [Vanilla planifolia]|uniref:protein phosphatase methylesterase-1 n=1 Tax=Vanilla planifolia TaxID=51239 RepID=A0A835VCS6_VANPL|nr:hypothetical protein HPP92_005618 [Vanilla planifolia]